MDRDVESVVAGELLPNEAVLWSGQPNPSKLFTKTDLFLIPLALAGIIAGGWDIYNALSFETLVTSFVFILFAVIFFPFAIYMAVGRFFAKAYFKKRTVYAVTDKRVMRLTLGTAGRKKKDMSADLMSIQKASVSLGRDKCGTLCFGAVPFFSKLFLNTGMEYMPGYHIYDGLVFFDVDNADQVFNTYKSAKASCQTAKEAL